MGGHRIPSAAGNRYQCYGRRRITDPSTLGRAVSTQGVFGIANHCRGFFLGVPSTFAFTVPGLVRILTFGALRGLMHLARLDEILGSLVVVLGRFAMAFTLIFTAGRLGGGFL